MQGVYYSGYALKWTMQWDGASSDPANPTLIPNSAENWLFYNGTAWITAPSSILDIWAPAGRGQPSLDFIGYLSFASAPAAMPALTFTVNATPKGGGQPGRGNSDPFAGPVPIVMTATGNQLNTTQFQYNGVAQNVIKNGAFAITIAISAVNPAGGNLYWRVDPEMEVSTDG